jgi:hypothetical protein
MIIGALAVLPALTGVGALTVPIPDARVFTATSSE